MSGGDWKELFTSAQNGDLELVKYHTEMGVDINYQHPEFLTTPLQGAVEKEQYEIAKYLLDNGADPLLKEHFGHHTPLSMAKFLKNKKLVALLEEYIK